MPKQSKRFWLARDCDYNVYRGQRKPKARKEDGYFCSAEVELCSFDFEAITGIRLKPGEVRRARIVLED